MTDFEDTSSPPVVYPPQGTPMDPADHPATNVPTATQHYNGNIRTKGLFDELNAMRKFIGKKPL